MILNYAKKREKDMLLSTIVMIVLGLVLLIEPAGSIKVITGIIGALFEVIGVLQIIDYIRQNTTERMMSGSLIIGIVLCIIGIFLFANLESLASLITAIIGVVIMVKSLFKIQFALNIRSLSDKWFYNLIIGILGMILGIVLLVNPFASAEIFLRVIGGFIVFGGVAEFVETCMVLKTLNDGESEVEKEVKEEDAIELKYQEKKPKKKKDK